MKNINFNRMMNKYIDAEKLKTKVKNLNLVTKTYEEQVAFNNALAMVVEIITSLQQEQPESRIMTREMIEGRLLQNDTESWNEDYNEEDWVEKRKQECWCRRLSDNGNYQCERYEGNFGPCDGRCSWIVDYPKLKELKEMKQSELDLDKEINLYCEKEFGKSWDGCMLVGCLELDIMARHFFELGQKDAANKFDEIEYNRQRAEEEMFDKGLDEAAEEYVQKGHLLPEAFIVIPTFKDGAKWQKEKLLKKSMRMYKCYDEEDNLVGFSTDYDAPGAYGNLVNIVILNTKEENK